MSASSGQIIQQFQWVTHDMHDWDIAASSAFSTSSSTAFVAGKDGWLRKVQMGHAGALWSTPVTTVDATPTIPTVGQAAHFCPGSAGGTEWNGPAYSEQDGMVFVNTVDQCNTVTLEDGSHLNTTTINNSDFTKGPVFNLSAFGAPWTGAVDYSLCSASSPPTPPCAGFGVPDTMRTGHLYAVDSGSGNPLWHFDAPDALLAGVTATQGGVVFTADLQGNFYAFDLKHGSMLKSIALGQPVGGGVITYLVSNQNGNNQGNQNGNNQTQYVAVAAGFYSPLIWHTRGANQIIVLGI
jgi:alcohol dehydrogenase (cytochrome c)